MGRWHRLILMAALGAAACGCAGSHAATTQVSTPSLAHVAGQQQLDAYLLEYRSEVGPAQAASEQMNQAIHAFGDDNSPANRASAVATVRALATIFERLASVLRAVVHPPPPLGAANLELAGAFAQQGGALRAFASDLASGDQAGQQRDIAAVARDAQTIADWSRQVIAYAARNKLTAPAWLKSEAKVEPGQASDGSPA